ncbi:hypothetical protein J6590_103573 [Homalodisca vitripennis]|nr:hypothetical protein J6590_103573 [Homalodisca vitripennis]
MILSTFAFTYVCEPTFSKLKFIENKDRCRLTNGNVETLLRSPSLHNLLIRMQYSRNATDSDHQLVCHYHFHRYSVKNIHGTSPPHQCRYIIKLISTIRKLWLWPVTYLSAVTDYVPLSRVPYKTDGPCLQVSACVQQWGQNSTELLLVFHLFYQPIPPPLSRRKKSASSLPRLQFGHGWDFIAEHSNSVN